MFSNFNKAQSKFWLNEHNQLQVMFKIIQLNRTSVSCKYSEAISASTEHPLSGMLSSLKSIWEKISISYIGADILFQSVWLWRWPLFLLIVLHLGLLSKILVVSLRETLERFVFALHLEDFHLRSLTWSIKIRLKVGLRDAVANIRHRRADILSLLRLRHVRPRNHINLVRIRVGEIFHISRTIVR